MEQDINSSCAQDMPILLKSGMHGTPAALQRAQGHSQVVYGAGGWEVRGWGDNKRQCLLRSGKNVDFNVRDLSYVDEK